MPGHSRRRPPWWPPDEPFPPAGGPGSPEWRRMRGFFWRIGAALILLFILAFGFFTFLFWSVVSFFGGPSLPPPTAAFVRPWAIPVLVFAFLVLFLGLNVLRRVALPLGDLVEAAGRVAEGDYSARVAERGPREVYTLARAFNSMAARLQSNAEQRRNLLADVTHELQTPLTVVQGNLEGLVDGIYPLDRDHLEPILEETRVLSRLIEDLRTLSLAESGALKLQREPTDLAVLASETVASFRPQADAAGIALQTDIAPDLPPAQVDPARVRQVLANLLANALRYTPKGGRIRVQCSVDTRRLAVAVSDTGAGIPPDDLPHIFDRFYKSRDSRGSGLGLAIARNLVAAHGGEITAHSQAGQGTTIRFTLPLA
jgi:signal transduction histidine kinase